MAYVKDKEQRDFRLVKNEAPQRMDFNKIKVGNKTLADEVTASLDFWKRRDTRINTDKVERAIKYHNLKELRAISDFYFDKSGIYSRLCRYMAFLYRYDWVVTPIVNDKKVKDEKVLEGWIKSSLLLENSKLKRTFGEIALKVVKNGCYYGCKMEDKDGVFLQELPVDYCRSRYKLKGVPAVEFNVRYFDDFFSDNQYKLRVLKLFSKEIQKGYVDYKSGKLPKDYMGDDDGWILLDPSGTVKFSLSNSDMPLFVSVIPSIMDLEDARDLDKKKMLQQLLRIVIQKLPLDKNGDLIFDTQEAMELHNNAVAMLSDAIGVDVLTTFATVDVADMSDNSNYSSVNQLEKVERTVYTDAGVSQMQFNTDGNLALEKSIGNDEATLTELLLQFEDYANSLLKPFNKNPNRLRYKVQMLPTTIYNYKDLSKLYKEQTMLGFSKLLPAVALGQSQTSVISTILFENKVLKLGDLLQPPQMSSTVSKSDSSTNASGEEKAKGRPKKPDDEKSDKTIMNKESES